MLGLGGRSAPCAAAAHRRRQRALPDRQRRHAHRRRPRRAARTARRRRGALRHDGADPEPRAREVRRRAGRRRTASSPASRGAGAAATSYHFIGVQVAEAPGVRRARRTACRTSRSAPCIRQLIAADAARDRGVRQPARRSATSARRPTTSTPRSTWRANEGDRLAQPRRRGSHASAVLERTALWDDVQVGRGAQLDRLHRR